MAKKSIAELTLHKLEYGVGAPAIPYDGSTRYVRITDIDDDGCLGADFVSPEYYEEKHVLQDGDILFARTGATVGKSFMYTPSYGKCVYAGFLIRMIPNKEQVLPSYVYYFTKSPSYNSFIAQNMKVVAQPNINAKQYASLTFEVPSLPDQAVVVKKLDKITTLISLRKQQIAKLDELVKARFVEMFGDPKTNPMDWSIVPIGSIIKSCESGWSGNGVQKMRSPGEIAVLKVSAVTKGYFIPDECKVLDDQENIKKYVFPEKGDLLFSRANTKELVGATAMILEDYPELILPDKLWKLRFFDQGNVYYMKHILSCASIREQFSAASTGTSGSMFNVSMDKFREIQIPLPPIEQQNQFAAFVAQTDQQKLTIQHSLAKLELLKKALMQKYFG